MNHREPKSRADRAILLVFITAVVFGAGASFLLGVTTRIWRHKPPDAPPRE